LVSYDFSRLGVFLIEDNGFIRQTLEDLLHYFKFGRVGTAKNGEEAIEYMKRLSGTGANTPPDIIISDLVMAPINGLLFLRWIRTAKESPNRMAPFIMLSGLREFGPGPWVHRIPGETIFGRCCVKKSPEMVVK